MCYLEKYHTNPELLTYKPSKDEIVASWQYMGAIVDVTGKQLSFICLAKNLDYYDKLLIRS